VTEDTNFSLSGGPNISRAADREIVFRVQDRIGPTLTSRYGKQQAN